MRETSKTGSERNGVANPSVIEGGTALARAVSLHLEGKGREALAELERAAESGDPAPEVLAAQAHIQFELEMYEEAVRSNEALLALDATSASAHFNLAVSLEKLGRWRDAAGHFEHVLVGEPGRIDARLGLGICQLHSRAAEPALECFETCLAAACDSVSRETARFGKAVALELLDRQEDALQLYREIIGDNPNAEEPMANLLHIGMRRGDEALVRDTSEKLLALRPSSQAALEGLAWCAFSSEDYEAATRYCTKLAELTPENFERWYNLGVAQQKLNHMAEAEKAYGEAVKLKPEHPQTWANLGVVQQGQGNSAQARRSYETALRFDADAPEVLSNLAGLLEEEGETSAAEELYARLVAKHPSWDDAWFRYGYLRLTRSDAQGAAQALEHCVSGRADWLEAHINLGLAYRQLGDGDRAAEHFQAALALKEDSVEALRGLAALAIEHQDHSKALDLQGRLIDLGERTPELFYNTGLLLQKQGNVNDAVALYREAIGLRPNFPEALLNLGHALKSQGRADEAKTCWRQALEMKPELAQGYFGT